MDNSKLVGNVPYTLDEVDKIFHLKEPRSNFDSFVRTELSNLIYIHLDPAKNLILPKDKYDRIQICIPNSSGSLSRSEILETHDDFIHVFTLLNFNKYFYQGRYELVNVVYDKELNEAIVEKYGRKTPEGKELHKIMFLERVKVRGST